MAKRICFLLAVLASALFGQDAELTGLVKDQAGAVVPHASVEVRNQDTGVRQQTTTNNDGLYSIPDLMPGNYLATVQANGFKTLTRDGILLQVQQRARLDITLELGSLDQKVTVTLEIPVVDPDKTEVSQVVSQTAVNNLPIAGRRWDTFVLLTPNATTDGTAGMVSYRGLSGLYNSNTVDGANNNQSFFSEARGRASSGAYVYSLDSIREYQVADSSYSAEIGQAAGGVVNAVTRSGTNQFYGDLFYYLRYPSWNALDPLPKSQGIYSQPVHQWQQFGLSFGGPLIKDKLFGFFTYDGSRKVNPISYTSTTYGPTVKALPCPTLVTATQCAEANGFLDSLVGQYPRATNNDILFGKLNWQINSRNSLNTSFDYANNEAPNAYNTAPSSNNDSNQDNGSYIYHERIFIANLDTILKSSMVNSARFQWGRDLEVAGTNAPAPYVSIFNITQYGENYSLPRTAEPDEHRTQIADTLSIIDGKHTIKTGFDLNFIHEVEINLYQGGGRYTYTGATATQAFDNWVLDVFNINTGDGLTGKHYSTFAQANDPITHVGKDDFWEQDVAGFFEDTWHATSKFTVTGGLRYDIFLIPQPPHPNTSTPLTTELTSTIGVPKGQLAPRLGSAWQITPRTVLRAGGGLFYAKTTDSLYYATRVENGVYQQTYNCTPATCPSLTFPNLIWTPPGPTPAAPFNGAVTPQITTFSPPTGTVAPAGQDPHWKNPSAWSGDVTLEHQLPGGISVSAAYVFSRGLHLPIMLDANLAPATTTKSYDILNASGATIETYTVPFYTTRIDPSIGIISAAYPVVNSWYHSGVFTVRRNFRHGLEFTSNYTVSKAVDDGQIIGSSGTFGGTDIVFDPYNIRGEYGPSDLDQRQRFVTNGSWMPEFKFSNRAAKWLANGWTLSNIVTLATGHPVQANITGTPTPLDGGLTAGDASNASAKTGRAGWLQRDPVYAPGYKDWDLRLQRTFSVTERIKLLLRGELFNVTNTTNILSVNTTAFTYLAPGSGACAGHTNACMIPSPTFMAPTATSSLIFGPRQVQISGSITF